MLAVKRVWAEKDQQTRNYYSLLWQPFLGVDLKEAGTKRTDRANGGNAQSVARRSGGNTQNMHPVPSGIPSEDSGALPAGMTPGETQYPAYRSRGNTQGTAVERPTIPSGDGGAVPDGLPPGNAQYPAHRSSGNPQDTAAGRPRLLAETAARYRTPWISPKEPRAS